MTCTVKMIKLSTLFVDDSAVIFQPLMLFNIDDWNMRNSQKL